MKKFLSPILGMAVFCLSFVSCSSDDDVTPQQNQLLIGKWNFIQEVTVDANGNVISTYNEDNGSCPLDIYEFKSNNSFEETDYTYNTTPANCQPDLDEGTWSLDNDNFVLKIDGEDETFTIKTLTSDTFELEQPSIGSGSIAKYRIVFKKM